MCNLELLDLHTDQEQEGESSALNKKEEKENKPKNSPQPLSQQSPEVKEEEQRLLMKREPIKMPSDSNQLFLRRSYTKEINKGDEQDFEEYK